MIRSQNPTVCVYTFFHSNTEWPCRGAVFEAHLEFALAVRKTIQWRKLALLLGSVEKIWRSRERTGKRKINKVESVRDKTLLLIPVCNFITRETRYRTYKLFRGLQRGRRWFKRPKVFGSLIHQQFRRNVPGVNCESFSRRNYEGRHPTLQTPATL